MLMRLEIPPASVRLDCNGLVLNSLREDTHMTLLDISAEVATSRIGKIIEAACGLLIPDTSTDQNLELFDAFCTGAAVGMVAFDESDAEVHDRNRVLKLINIGWMPCSVLSDNQDEIFSGFEQIAEEGHASHGELKEIIKIIKEFHASSRQDVAIGRIASCGFGFGLYQVDRAWNQYRSRVIDIVCEAESKTFDVNALLD